jgi:hypothetical protein
VVTRQDNQAVLFVNTGLRVGILVGGVLGLTGLGLGEWVVLFFLGSDYAYAGKLLGIGLWLCIPWLLATAMWQVLLAHGYFSLPSLALLGGAVVMTSLLPTLVTLLDAAGALLALGLGVGTWPAIAYFGHTSWSARQWPGHYTAHSCRAYFLGVFLAFKQYGAGLIFLGSLLMLLLCAVACRFLPPRNEPHSWSSWPTAGRLSNGACSDTMDMWHNSEVVYWHKATTMTSPLDALQPIFIVGTDKSGTSFLLSLLNSHPATITLYETYMYHFPQKTITHQEVEFGGAS